MNRETINRDTEKRPHASLDGISANSESRVVVDGVPDYTSIVNDVTDSLGCLTEHLKILKDQLEPILKCNPPCDPCTKGTEDIGGQSRFRTDMETILSAIRLITDEVRWISHEVDL